jgi:peptidyl-prolyl cis-trans isomerase B (cyclophilin B)
VSGIIPPGDGEKQPPKPPPVVRSSGSKREKDIARQKAERQAARRAEREAKQKRQAIVGGTIAIIVVALLIGLIAWAPWKGSGTVATPSATPTTTAPTPTPTVQIAGCTTAPPVRTTVPDFNSPPKYDSTKGTVLNLNTNCGLIAIQTDPVKAPGTTANMLGLAQAGYFDLTKCHRLVTQGIYVLQCGDPKGDGTGGPSYTINDEGLPTVPKGKTAPTYTYKAGTVAMANRGPNTGSSQFFIVYKDSPLPHAYTEWGTVTEGLAQVQAIANAGVQGGGTDGPPAQPVVIKTATVSKK